MEIRKLSKEFDGNKILDDINVNIPLGKIIGLVGPNGVGKSTLLKAMMGVYEPDSGDILIDGVNILESPKIKENVSYVGDESYYLSEMKVKDLIKVNALIYPNYDINKFNKLNQIFKIPVAQKVKKLSKGMKMRVFLMHALSANTKYVLLDEPLDGLDPIAKNNLLKIIVSEVGSREVTFLISSHNLGELERICDDVLFLEEGKVKYNESLEIMKGNIRKVQVKFNDSITEFPKINGVISYTKVGRVYYIITDKFGEDFVNELKSYGIEFYEEIDLSLEEMFIATSKEA